MRITGLKIKNFRSIKDSTDIGDITQIFALIGRNNAGKSAVLKAIQLLMGERKIEINDFHKDTEESIEISVTTETWKNEEKEVKVLKVVFTKDLESKRYVNDEEVATAKFNKELPEVLSINDIRNPKESTGGGRDSTLLNKILSLQAESQNTAKYEALSQQIQELKKAESEEVSKKITEKFQDITSETTFDITVSPTVDIDKSVSFKTGVQNTAISEGKVVDILNCGTGLQSMYILALLEVWAEMAEKQDNTILLVEEPEVYLHPEYQRRMFAALRRISSNNQVIFTTHSPIMIADIWLTRSVRQVRLNAEGETQIENVKVENVIDELGIRYEDVLNPKLVVFVEGKDDIKFYEKLGIQDPKVKIISTDSFRAIHYFAFIKIISSEHVSNNFVVIADSDGDDPVQRAAYLETEIFSQFQTPPDGLKKKVEGNIFVLEKYAVESYLLDAALLQKAFPGIVAASIISLLKDYEEKYQEQLAEVKAKKITLKKFQSYLKPKHIFEKIRHAEFDKSFREFWSDKKDFLTARDLIVQRCENISKAGTDWFDHILEYTELDKIPELSNLKAGIIGKI